MLEDRTNETILLAQHEPMLDDDGRILHDAQLEVDVDSDSSYIPSIWVYISLTDSEHDSDTIQLTLGEASLLHDRLGLILGRSGRERGAE